MFVRQAANVLELLEYFAKRKRPAIMSEIADDLGWPRSSAFNLVGTLVDRGFLYEPRTRGGFYPSPRWLSLAQEIADAEPLPEAVYTLLREVRQETDETTAIGAPAGISAVFIAVEETQQAIRYFANVGRTLPIHATATGRAILEQYTPEERQQLYRRIEFVQYLPATLVSIEAVEAEIRRSVQRGWHQSNSEFSDQLVGVSLPLRVNERRLSISIAGPGFRCEERREEFARILHAAIDRFQPLFTSR